ncbi:MAG: response regulator, partial [Acidobacteria bacterium]|nr:response regulator [Acidobacteriota bacterium]
TLAAAVEDGFVKIIVGDTGVGMPANIRARVFDPFFTTKGVRGMGLGLAVSYGIVCRHNGTITVESEVGRGTVFTIKLPLAACSADSQTKTELSVIKPVRRSNMPKILVVDDEAVVRELLRDLLADEGFEVDIASEGMEALALFDSKSFDAVFTDIGMPGMSGWELARAIRARNDDIPMAVITGWGEMVDATDRESAQVDWVLTKPFSMAQISEITQEISRHLKAMNTVLPYRITA